MNDILVPQAKLGRWTLVSFIPGSKKTLPRTRAMWRCVCDCGTIRSVRSDFLASGQSRSCGCTIAAIHSRGIGQALTVSQRRPAR